MVHNVSYVFLSFPTSIRNFIPEFFGPLVIYRIAYFGVVLDLSFQTCNNLYTYVFSKELLVIELGHICREMREIFTDYIY